MRHFHIFLALFVLIVGWRSTRREPRERASTKATPITFVIRAVNSSLIRIRSSMPTGDDFFEGKLKGVVMRNRTSFLMTSAIGSLVLALSIALPAIAEKKSSDMQSMKQMVGECRQHHNKAAKAIDQMLLKMEEAQRSNEAAKMRTALEESQTNLVSLKQDMAACMNAMSMMENMGGGMGGKMGEMGGMREGMEGMMERKSH